MESPFIYDIGNNRALIVGGLSSTTLLDEYRCWIYNIDEDTLQRAADLPNVFSDAAGAYVALQNTFHLQEICAISFSNDLAFHCGQFSNDPSDTIGGQSELYSTGNKNCKGKHDGWNDLNAPDKAMYRARNKARLMARRRRG